MKVKAPRPTVPQTTPSNEPRLSRGSFFCASTRTAKRPTSRNRLRIIDRQPSAYPLTRPYLQLPRPYDCQYGRYFELPSVRSPKYLPYFQSPPVRSSKYLPYFQSLPLGSSKYLPYWQPPTPPQSQIRTRHAPSAPSAVPKTDVTFQPHPHLRPLVGDVW